MSKSVRNCICAKRCSTMDSLHEIILVECIGRPICSLQDTDRLVFNMRRKKDDRETPDDTQSTLFCPLESGRVTQVLEMPGPRSGFESFPVISERDL